MNTTTETGFYVKIYFLRNELYCCQKWFKAVSPIMVLLILLQHEAYMNIVYKMTAKGLGHD